MSHFWQFQGDFHCLEQIACSAVRPYSMNDNPSDSSVSEASLNQICSPFIAPLQPTNTPSISTSFPNNMSCKSECVRVQWNNALSNASFHQLIICKRTSEVSELTFVRFVQWEVNEESSIGRTKYQISRDIPLRTWFFVKTLMAIRQLPDGW